MHTEIIFQVTWRYDHEYMKLIRSDDETNVCPQGKNILQGKKEESSSEVAISFSSDDDLQRTSRWPTNPSEDRTWGVASQIDFEPALSLPLWMDTDYNSQFKQYCNMCLHGILIYTTEMRPFLS